MFNRIAALPRAACWAVATVAGALSGCASLSPVAPDTRVGDRPAQQVVLALDEPCSLSPGGAPQGRPDQPGAGGHTLPAGRYVPRFEDDDGIFFASPNGVVVAQPTPTGPRSYAGGIYLPKEHSAAAQEYLGDAGGVSQRHRLPEHCRYSIENAAAPATPG